jgi:membrane protein implicated in regulation of membrane protease activity
LQAKGIFVAIFTSIGYLLLWKSGYFGWSPGCVVLIAAVPIFFAAFAAMNTPVELIVAGIILISLPAFAMPVLRRAREKKQRIEEQKRQRMEQLQKELYYTTSAHSRPPSRKVLNFPGSSRSEYFLAKEVFVRSSRVTRSTARNSRESARIGCGGSLL